MTTWEGILSRSEWRVRKLVLKAGAWYCQRCKAFTLTVEDYGGPTSLCPKCKEGGRWRLYEPGLKPAAFLAAGDESPAASRPKPAALPLPEHVFEPEPSALAGVVASNGGAAHKARLHLIADSRAKLAKLALFGTAVAEKIEERLRAAESARYAACQDLAVAVEKLHELQNRLVERADLRRQIADMTAELAAAKATLGDPASLKLDPGQLLLLAQRERHLPTELESLAARLEPLKQSISSLSADLQVDASAVVQKLYLDACERVGGGSADPHIKQLFENGFFADG